MVIRDIDILKEMDDVSVGTSIVFHDDDQRKLFEKCTLPNEDRFRALARLKNEGIDTYALICPVIPFITDVKKLIDEVEPFVDSIWIYPLEIKSKEDKNWINVHFLIGESFTDFLEEYEDIVSSKDHPYWGRLASRLREERKDMKINIRL